MSLFAFKSEKFVCCSGFPEVCFQLLFLVKRLLKVHGFEWQIKGTYFWSVVKLSFLFLFYVYSVMRKEKWVKLSHINNNESVQFSSVQLLSHVWLFVTPWTTAHQASMSITNSWNLLKFVSIESVMPSNHLILCHPLLLPPSIFPSIRVFSNESALRIRWPKYWSFSFSI